MGAKTILYHLHHAGDLSSSGAYLPRSPRKIWQILKAAGWIPNRVHFHHPAPLRHAELTLIAQCRAEQEDHICGKRDRQAREKDQPPMLVHVGASFCQQTAPL